MKSLSWWSWGKADLKQLQFEKTGAAPRVSFGQEQTSSSHLASWQTLCSDCVPLLLNFGVHSCSLVGVIHTYIQNSGCWHQCLSYSREITPAAANWNQETNFLLACFDARHWWLLSFLKVAGQAPQHSCKEPDSASSCLEPYQEFAGCLSHPFSPMQHAHPPWAQCLLGHQVMPACLWLELAIIPGLGLARDLTNPSS